MAKKRRRRRPKAPAAAPPVDEALRVQAVVAAAMLAPCESFVPYVFGGQLYVHKVEPALPLCRACGGCLDRIERESCPRAMSQRDVMLLLVPAEILHEEAPADLLG